MFRQLWVLMLVAIVGRADSAMYRVPEAKVLSDCLCVWLAHSDSRCSRVDDIAAVVVPQLTNTDSSPLTALFLNGVSGGKTTEQLEIMANWGESIYGYERCHRYDTPHLRHQCHHSIDKMRVAPMLMTALKQCCA